MSSPGANKLWNMARHASSDLRASLNKNEQFQLWTKMKDVLLVDSNDEWSTQRIIDQGERGAQ